MPLFHELADCFPLLEGPEFAELVGDIEVHGLHQPVVMFEGKILDGRNRWRACQQLGIAHREITYQGDTPAEFVWGINAVRRQLSPSQKALAASRMVTVSQHMNQHTVTPDDVTTREAARLAGVGRRTADRAKRVLDDGAPEVIDAVRSGGLTLTPAERLVRLPREEQSRIMQEVPLADIPSAVPEPRWNTTGTPTVKEARPVGRGQKGPVFRLLQQLRQSSAEGSKLRLAQWQENRGLIPGLPTDELAEFVRDLKAERVANTQLIKMIENTLKEEKK